MAINGSTNSSGGWVRLVYLSATIGLDRWPGPHRPGSVIHSSGGGSFVFDHLDHYAVEGPEVVYVWTPVS